MRQTPFKTAKRPWHSEYWVAGRISAAATKSAGIAGANTIRAEASVKAAPSRWS
jgi:hypothetical protein